MKKYKGFVNIEYQISSIIKPIMGKKKDNFIILSNLIKVWRDIAGEKLYQFCEPYKIKFEKDKKNFGILYIKAFDPSTAFYLESISNEIVEKICAYYGYKIISKIRIQQELKNLNLIQNNDKKRSLDEKSQKIIADQTINIKDSELKDTLVKLANIIFDKN